MKEASYAVLQMVRWIWIMLLYMRWKEAHFKLRVVPSPLTEENINQIKVRLLLLRLISMIIWILRLTAELIKMIIITGLLQILGAMWVVMAEIVILKFMEARLLAANCCGFMVRVPKR